MKCNIFVIIVFAVQFFLLLLILNLFLHACQYTEKKCQNITCGVKLQIADSRLSSIQNNFE